MKISNLLSKIKSLNARDTENISLYGEQQLGENGIEINSLLSIDRKTIIPTSQLQREFYKFSAGWKHCAIELYWPDPRSLRSFYQLPSVADTIESDLSDKIDQMEFLTDDCFVLFAVDDADSVFQRSYFVHVGEKVEPKIMDCGSEIKLFDSLEEYLEFWRDVIAS